MPSFMENRREKIVRRYLAGESYAELAVAYHLAPTTVAKIVNFVLKAPLVRYGRDRRNREIVERFKAGETAQKLADQYGVCKATIYRLSRLAKASFDIQTSDNTVKHT